MKKILKDSIFNNLKPLIIVLGALGFLFPNQPVISETSFLFCLKPQVAPFEINRNNDNFVVDNKNINRFLHNNNIMNIERWIPRATEMDHDGDIYLNRIYRAYIHKDNRESLSSIIMQIESLAEIHYAENEYIRMPKYTPNDPLVVIQCSLNSVKVPQAWDFWDIPNGVIPEGREILLASVDTGVDYTHPDLQNSSWINQAEIPEWMSEAGLDQDGDGFIEASEVVGFLESEGMDINSDGVINLRDAVFGDELSPFEDGIDNDGNGYIDDLLGWDSSGWYGTDDNDPFPKESDEDNDVANNSTWAHGTHVAGILAATSDNDLGIASTAYNAKFISV